MISTDAKELWLCTCGMQFLQHLDCSFEEAWKLAETALGGGA